MGTKTAIMSLEEFVTDNIPKEFNNQVLPFFKRNSKTFEDFKRDRIKKYAEYLYRINISLIEKRITLQKQVDLLQEKIRDSLDKNIFDQKQTVISEIRLNVDLVNSLIEERIDYIEYMTTVMKEARELEDPDVDTKALADIASNCFSTIIDGHISSLKALKAQKMNLLSEDKIKTLPENLFQELFEKRINTFKKELSEAEKELSDTVSDLMLAETTCKKLHIGQSPNTKS